MPFRFDDTFIPGFLKIDGYVPIGTRSPEDIANLILQRISGQSVSHDELIWESQTKLKEYYRLPSTSGLFFGRTEIFDRLDNAWRSSTVNILTLVAPGGVGKTSLVKAWVDRLKEKNDHCARAIYSHSFYFQGALQHSEKQDEAKSTGDEFLSAALNWFGDAKPDEGSPISKAERLAEHVRKRRTLLILDGLEPLQHSVDEFRGNIRDLGIHRLVVELGRKNDGLCIITSRVPIAELQEFTAGDHASHVEFELPNLSTIDGVALLTSTGVEGANDELTRAVEEFDGHALALTLLGSFLAKQFGGDIRCRDRLGPLVEERQHGGHARRVMQSYESLFAGRPELSLLYILGLFDRPASIEAVLCIINPRSKNSARSLNSLRRELMTFPGASPARSLLYSLVLRIRNRIARLARYFSARKLRSPFGSSFGRKFDESLLALRDLGLVNQASSEMPDYIDCHPLVRQHFGDAFRRLNPPGWKDAHSRLFDYYAGAPSEYQPTSLVKMEPLYAAVAHGCQAGRLSEAGLVYYRRMLRGAVYSCNHLGALQSDLAILTFFFDKTWTRPQPGLTKQETSLLLHWSSTLLLTLGRYKEGLPPIRAALDLALSEKAWWRASTSSYYLSVAQMNLGDLDSAREESARSVSYTLSEQDPYWSIGAYASLGRCLHMEGLFQEARDAFQLSEDAMIREDPKISQLHSVWSYWYCELLLDLGEFELAMERGSHALQLAPTQPKSAQGALLDKTVSELTIARARLMADSQTETRDLSEAHDCFDRAFESLRLVNHQWLMPDALLGRAQCHRMNGDFVQADLELSEITTLTERDGLKLYEVDCEIGIVHLYICERKLALAREILDKVEIKVGNLGYHRHDVRLLLLRASLGQVEKQPREALGYLTKAKGLTTESGFQQWLVQAFENDYPW